MKYIESVFFACALICIGLMMTSLVGTLLWVNILLIMVAGILFGSGIYFKEKRRNEGQKEIVASIKSMTIQQQELLSDVINSNHKTHSSLNELKTVVDHSNGLMNESMKEVISQLERNHSKIYGLLDQELSDILQEIRTARAAADKQILDFNVSITKSMEQVSHDVVSKIEQGNKDAADFYSSLLPDMRKLDDSLHDLERKWEILIKQVLEEMENGQESLAEFYDQYTENIQGFLQQYADLNENMIQYQIQVKRAAEDIEEYRDHTEADILERIEILKNLVNQLSETTDQLADSKHHEREKAFEVQKKLAKQFERLKSRG